MPRLPRSNLLVLGAALCCLQACGIDEFLGDSGSDETPLAGERIAIFSYQSDLTPDETLAQAPLTLPEAQNVESFPSAMHAQQRGASNLRVSGFSEAQAVTIGEGESWTTSLIAAPVASETTVFAMDASGTISAHDATNIDSIRWVAPTRSDDDAAPMTGGGLAYSDGVLYATTANGSIVALVAADGSLLWRYETSMPIRSAPAAAQGQVYALTIDNQLLAFSARTGQQLWTHRGIREVAAYLGNAQPVVENGIVVVAYSSGELFALRAEDGSALWSDSLISSKRSAASANVTGISATPLLHDNLVYAISNNGLMAASILSTGRGVWDMPLSATHTPWLSGDYLYILSSDNHLIALHKGNRLIKWIRPLTNSDTTDAASYSAPMMVNGQILLIHSDGTLLLINPENGETLSEKSAPTGGYARPIVVKDKLYMVDSSARLHRFE